MPAGRPTEYTADTADQAYKLCLLGATDAQLAEFFDVSETTINNWKLAHPEFIESIKRGKEIADANVAQSLYGRATGAQWTEDAAFKVRKVIFDDKGKKLREEEEVVTVPIRRGAPPDTPAGIFWLKNRRSKDWRDKISLTGPDGEGPIEHKIDAGELIERIVGNRGTTPKPDAG